MNVFSVIGLCLCATVAILLLRETHRALVSPVVIALGVTVLLASLPAVGEIAGLIGEIADTTGIAVSAVILRALGIACLTSIGAELCRSVGEPSVVSYIETAGKCAIIALAVPLVRELFDLIIMK